MFPSMRLGYVVIPFDLIERFAAMRQVMDICPTHITQAVMSELVPSARATVTSLTGAAGNLGASLGASIAGMVVGVLGYTAIGPTAGVLSLASLALMWLFVHERQPDAATASSRT